MESTNAGRMQRKKKLTTMTAQVSTRVTAQQSR